MSVVECGGGLSLVDCQGCRMVSVLASALVAGVGGGGVDGVGSGEGGCCSSFGGEVGDSDDGTGFGVDGLASVGEGGSGLRRCVICGVCRCGVSTARYRVGVGVAV